MKALYVTSIENFSGKTAITLAIGKRLQVEGYKVGYLKPVSYEATKLAGRVVDEDVSFVRNALALEEEARDLSPVVVTPSLIPDYLGTDQVEELRKRIMTAFEMAGKGRDVVLLEGGGSLRMGYALGLSTAYVAEMLGAAVLAVVMFRGRMRLLDDALAAQFRLGDRLTAMILNRVPTEELDFVKTEAIPFFEEKGIPVVGTLLEHPHLAAISVCEIADVLDAKVLTKGMDKDAMVETLMVGAMGAQEALSRMRMHRNKAVITGGDRIDLHLAALETSTRALILTGNLRPSAGVIDRANELGVTVMLVPTNTMETVEAIESIFGKTRLGQAEKLAHFESLMAEYVDYGRLFDLLELEKG